MRGQVEKYFVIDDGECLYICVRDSGDNKMVLNFLKAICSDVADSIFYRDVTYCKFWIGKELVWSVGDILRSHFNMVVIDYVPEVRNSGSGVSLVDAFDRAAQNWGLMIEEGYGKEVDKSEKRYYDTMTDLIGYILELEQKVESYEGK